MGWKSKMEEDSYGSNLTDAEIEKALHWVESVAKRGEAEAEDVIEIIESERYELKHHQMRLEAALARMSEGDFNYAADQNLISQQDAELANNILANFS
jgi:hypothetical protein